MSSQQPYDSSLKALIQEQAPQIFPVLFGVEFERTLTIEVLRPPMRADGVSLVKYKGKPHVLHLEFESGADPDMAYRLLVYHAGSLDAHRLPVISVIVYLFPVTMVVSPFREESVDEDLLNFHFRTLPLWKLDAERYVKEHATSLYTLLPTMKGANASLLLQAIEEMAEHYRDQEDLLSRQFIWFRTLLRRAETVPSLDKRRVEERLHMFDNLLEQDPDIQRLRAESEAKGRVEGEVKALQKSVINIVRGRFPTLTEFAQQKVSQVNKPDVLYFLVEKISIITDEASVRLLLDSHAA